LLALIALIATRQDLRHQALESIGAAARHVAHDRLGLSPRQIFVWRLQLAGLADSPLGRRWQSAVERAGESPIRVEGRYRVDGHFTSDSVEAHVYQLQLERGEKLVWQLSRESAPGATFYASLERRRPDGPGWSTVTDLETSGRISNRIVEQDGKYRIILQPELFGEVRYALAIASGGSLAFPVQGASSGDIGSRFGAPRDGGAREHHGVDIFVERGTPVVAVADGSVRVDTGGLGGKHIWLTGGFMKIGSARYYYAHLDEFAVASGDRVSRGDVVGYVGNTGNARSTPPHLHFGIYTFSGPVNPAAFLGAPPELPN
jgi:murein DD-endopeptidase MepM/ murein hydrolase activator NlpD